MDTSQIASLVFLVILGLSILGSFIAQTRDGIGQAARHGLIWVLIFVGVIAAIGLWDDVRNDIMPQQAVISDTQIEVPRGIDGHYHLTLQVNGVDVDFLVDTGASQVVLNLEDARRVGFDVEDLNFIFTANTANGEVDTAPVRLDTVRLGEIKDFNLRASVNGGELHSSLLGMAYLSRFQSIEIRRDTLVLTR